MPKNLAANSDNSNLDVMLKRLGYSNQEVCHIDRQDVGQILFKQLQILKIARCLYECFKTGELCERSDSPATCTHPKLCDSAIFK